MTKPLTLLLLTLTLATAHAKPKAAPDHWVGTWAAAPYAFDSMQTPSPFGATDTTVRETVHLSLGGPLVRIVLTNEFGSEPLTVEATHIALAGTIPGDISLTTAQALTFNGQSSITIPPGAVALSDPATLALPPFADLTVSLFIPAQPLTHATFHNSAYTSNFTAADNVVGQRTLPNPTPLSRWFFLKDVEVQLPASAGTIVAFGDSITDGTRSTPDTNNRWPDELARRLQAHKATRQLGVLNEGIGGNRVLHNTTGPNALARFDRDVLAQPGVRGVIILESINDIGNAYNTTNPHDPVTAQDLIQGLSQLVDRAHAAGLKAYLATITPYMGAGYSSPAGEQVRTAVNDWIRANKYLDGIIDFDAATRDPANPATFNPKYDSGDHLHPNDAGLKAMGDAIDLKLFEEKK